MNITLQPTLKQHQAYQLLSDQIHKYILFGGGAGGGKSWLGCEWEITNAIRYPGYKGFIGRTELKRLMASTYVTFKKVGQFHKIPPEFWKLNGQYNYMEFKNGSRIDLLDVAYLPRDPLYERFGSLEYTNGWLEEAGEVPFPAFDVLKSRIGRHMNKDSDLLPKILLTCNPKKNWLYQLFYKLWKEKNLPEDYAFVQSLYGDNPHTADSYEEQLSSISDQATKQRLKFGNWEYDDDPSTLMSYDNITDIFTNPEPEDKTKYLVCDVARFGRDKTKISLWRGMHCYSIFSYDKTGVNQTVSIIKDLLTKENIPYSHCLIDEDGVGGGVLDYLSGAKGFIANRSPFPNPETQDHEKENYKSLKDQCGYKLAEIVNGHRMKVTLTDTKIKEELIDEMEQIKTKDADKDGPRKLQPKEFIKECIGRSPDTSDNLLMRMYFEYDKPNKIAPYKQPDYVPQGPYEGG